jgi:response regulator of citrate/malate metabolism
VHLEIVAILKYECKKCEISKWKELKEAFNHYNSSKNRNVPTAPIQLPVQHKEETKVSYISSANNSIVRQHKFEKVKELYNEGLSMRQIARTIKITRITIRKYITMEQLGKREPSSSTNLDSFISFLLQEDNKNKAYRDSIRSYRKWV